LREREQESTCWGGGVAGTGGAEGERKRESQANATLSVDPDVGLNVGLHLMTLRSSL